MLFEVLSCKKYLPSLKAFNANFTFEGEYKNLFGVMFTDFFFWLVPFKQPK